MEDVDHMGAGRIARLLSARSRSQTALSLQHVQRPKDFTNIFPSLRGGPKNVTKPLPKYRYA